MSAKQLFIIGAGASNGAAYLHEKYKPPLTPDLQNIFNHDFITINHTVDGPYLREWFADLLEITGTKNDIEEFFTLFFSLEVVRSKINPGFVFLSDEQIHDLLSKSSILEQYFQKREIEIIKKILDYYLRNPKASILACPRNLETFFTRALYEYIWTSITNCNCKYHSLLFSNLTSDDAVVSFNYDAICDFTLYRLGKLTRSSFDGLGFSEVIILNDKNSKDGVKFLHIHGSFNWWSELGGNGYNGIYYNLVNENCKSNQIGNTPYPIILPFKQKKILYESILIYKRHVDIFLELIEESTIIYIVGKTFDNSDSELNSMIRERSQKLQKKLYIINHHFEDPMFIKKHEDLFNAKYVQGWKDLEHYYQQNMSEK